MKRRSFITAIFVITFLLSTISIAQAHGPGRGRFNDPGREMCNGAGYEDMDACLGELDLSSDQIAQLKKIRQEHMENMDRIREEMRKYRSQQRKQLQNGADMDEKSLEEMLNQGAEMWKEREREQIRYRHQISNLLTQKQRDSLYMCKSFRPKPGREDQHGRPPFPPEE
ncbi:MAG: Spy/CpxP family protein refolding chaperone [bacterium]